MTDKQRNMSYVLGELLNILENLELITSNTHNRAIRRTEVLAIYWAGVQWDKKMEKNENEYSKSRSS